MPSLAFITPAACLHLRGKRQEEEKEIDRKQTGVTDAAERTVSHDLHPNEQVSVKREIEFAQGGISKP